METKKISTKADKYEKALQVSRRLAERYRETNKILEAVLPDVPNQKQSAS